MKSAACLLGTRLAGLSPEAAASALAVGLVFGVFPVYGCPTLLCAMAAVLFRLNLPAVQMVNQLSSPLQWVLVIPFARAGARILGGHGGWNLAGAARDAIAGWFCLSLPLGLILYLLLRFSLRRCRQQCFNGLESPG